LMFEHYRQAVRQGARQPQVVHRLAELLKVRGQHAEAREVIETFLKATPFSEGLQKLAAEMSLENEMAGQALEIARSAVSPDSKDPNDHLWLGQFLLADGKQKEAEAEFENAVALGGDAPIPWVALVQFHVFTKDVKKAQAVVERVATTAAADKRTYVLAQC